MATKSWKWALSITNNLQSVRANLKTVSFELPEKYKGTIVEKWAFYWKNLFRDYKDVVLDTIKDVKEKPRKATFIITGLGFLAYCGKNNPDQISFRDKLLESANDMLLVGAPIRKAEAIEHLEFLERCYNAGLMRRLTLGVVSFMWVDNYDAACGLYATQCSYLKPRYLTFYERLVDVGFLSHWWKLERTMVDFDINPSEFEDTAPKELKFS